MVLIEYFYNGRIFSIYHSGMAFERTFPGKITGALHRMCDREIARMASGLCTTSRFGHGMLQFLSRPAAWKADPAPLAIR
jgi:hypothetical protein